MASTLVKEVFFRVSAQLQDINPQFVRWPQRELVNSFNDGARAIAKYLPSSCARVDAVKLVPGTKQSIEKILAASIKPGDGSTPADVYGGFMQAVIRNMGANGLTPGRAVRIQDRETLDTNIPDWHSTPSSPVTGFVFDPRFPKVFYVYPAVPATPDSWVELAILANPVELSQAGSYGMDGTDATVIPIDDKYVDDLMNYMIARAELKDAEYAADAQMVSAHTQLFTGSINAQVMALTGVNPNLRGLPMNSNVPKTRAV